MPEMSALIVQEPSMLNDSAQFCLDEIFQNSTKKNKNKGELKNDLIGFSGAKGGKIDNMNNILSRMDSKIPSGYFPFLFNFLEPKFILSMGQLITLIQVQIF